MPDRDFAGVHSTIEKSQTPVQGPQQVVLAIYAAVAADNFEALQAHFTADAELHIYGFPASEGSWIGREQVLRAVQSNFAMITDQRLEITAIVQQDQVLAVRVHETGQLKADLRRYESNGVIWFTFEGLQVKRVEEFFHSVLRG